MLHQAIDTYSEVIRIVKLNLNKCSKLMVESLKRMGAIHLEKSRNIEALEALAEAVEIEKSWHGENSVEIGHILLSIAGVYDARADEDGSLAVYTDALRVFKANLGSDDVSVALSLNNIGTIMCETRNNLNEETLCTA